MITFFKAAVFVLGFVFVLGLFVLALSPVFLLWEKEHENDPARRAMPILAYFRSHPRPRAVSVGRETRTFLFQVWLVALGFLLFTLLAALVGNSL